MPGKSKGKKGAKASAGLPQPEVVPKDKVGETVQDFIDFGGAKAVEAHEQNPNNWLVTATG
jgi:hypothetical protein